MELLYLLQPQFTSLESEDLTTNAQDHQSSQPLLSYPESVRTGQLRFAGKEMSIFWVWHSGSAIPVDEMAHREQIQGKVDFRKMCRMDQVGIQKIADAARGGQRSKKQPSWGEGYAGGWLLELRVRSQRVSSDGDLAVRGQARPSEDKEQEKLNFGSHLVEEQIVPHILVSLGVVISNRQNMIANVEVMLSML